MSSGIQIQRSLYGLQQINTGTHNISLSIALLPTLTSMLNLLDILLYRSTPFQPTVPENEPPAPTDSKEFPLPPKVVTDEAERVCNILKQAKRDKLSDMFKNCYPNTLATTATLLNDNTTYVITGTVFFNHLPLCCPTRPFSH